MGRRSAADEIIIDQAEDLIKRIHKQCGVNKSIKQVLADDKILLGETLMIVSIFTAADHLKIEDPVLLEFIAESTHSASPTV